MDAVICLGNSFAHLPDFSGDNTSHLQSFRNFYDELRPGTWPFLPCLSVSVRRCARLSLPPEFSSYAQVSSLVRFLRQRCRLGCARIS